MGIERQTITDDDGSGTTGTVFNAAFWTAHYDAIDANPGEWTEYTPTWAGNTATPSIGNGTLAAKYAKVGKLVFFEISLTWGTTTDPGTGFWTFTLPSTSAVSTGACFPGRVFDSGTGWLAIVGRQLSSTTITMNYENPASTTGVGAGVPITWAQNDTLVINGWYLEA
jgi:hypothetical protein